MVNRHKDKCRKHGVQRSKHWLNGFEVKPVSHLASREFKPPLPSSNANDDFPDFSDFSCSASEPRTSRRVKGLLNRIKNRETIMKAVKFLAKAIALAPLMPAIALIYLAYFIAPSDDVATSNDDDSNRDVTCLNSWSDRDLASSNRLPRKTVLGV